jgi:hypothetical protein
LVSEEPFLSTNSGEVCFYSELSPAGVGGATTRPGAAGNASGSINYKVNLRFKVAEMNYLGKLEY